MATTERKYFKHVLEAPLLNSTNVKHSINSDGKSNNENDRDENILSPVNSIKPDNMVTSTNPKLN
jgi:hypothetical protein